VLLASKSSQNWFSTQKLILHLFKKHFLQSSFLDQRLNFTYTKLFETFLETIFWQLCQCSRCFCSDFLGAYESSFENTF
jgi:hypothetical protein